MSTSKRIISLLLALVMVLGMLPWDALGVEAAGLGRVIHVAEEPVKLIQNEEPIANSDGIAVTRAQWLQMLVAVFGYSIEDEIVPDNYYPDLSEEAEYYEDILVAIYYGLVDVLPNSPMEPEAAATREFAVSTLNSCMGYLPENEPSFVESETVTYPDDIQVAIEQGWFSLSDGAFLPEQPITQEEFDLLKIAAEEYVEEFTIVPTESQYSFKDGIIEITDKVRIETVDDVDTVTITNCTVDIAAGDKFVVYSGGLAVPYQAESVSLEGANTVISTADLAFEDAIETMLVQQETDTDPANFYAAEDAELIFIEEESGQEYSQQAVMEQMASGSTKVYVPKYSKTMDFYNGAKLSLNVELKNAKVCYDVNIGILKGNASVWLDTDVEVSGKLSCDVDDILDNDIEIYIGGYEVPGVGGLSVYIKVDVTGSLSVVKKYHMKLGLKVGCDISKWKGSVNRIFKLTDKGSCYNAEISSKICLEVKFGLYGKALPLKGYFYGEGGFKATVKYTTYQEIEGSCTHFAAYLYAEFGAKAEWEILGYEHELDLNIEVIKEENSPVKIGFHYEDGRYVYGCTREGMTGTTTGDPSKIVDSGYSTGYDSSYFGSGLYSGGSSTGYGYGGEPIIIYTYSLDEKNNATITSYSGNATSLTIPLTLDGYNVIAIGEEAFAGNTSIHTIVMQDNIITIGAKAFYGCTSLRNLLLSENLKEIGSCAFQNCISLTVVDMPDSISTIAGRAFNNCTSLQMVNIPLGWEKVTPYYAALFNPYYESPFSECPNLTSITIPEGIEKIPDYAFYNANGLVEVNLPETLTSIGESAFRGCSKMTSIRIPNTVTTIGIGAFQSCEILAEIRVSNSLAEIGAYGFAECRALKTIALPDTVTTIGGRAFNKCTNLESINIPLGWTTVLPYDNSMAYNARYESPFSECPNLTSITIPEGITTVPSYAFYNASGLTEIHLPDTLTSIGVNAFCECSKLESVTIPNAVTNIDTAAFQACTLLSEIKLSNSLVRLGAYSFAECSTLKAIVLPEALDAIGGRAFYKCTDLEKVDIPLGWTTVLPYDNSMAFNAQYESPFSECPNLTSITIPKGVTAVPSYAFDNAVSLQVVTIPDTLISIGNCSFRNCSALKEAILPNGLVTISNNAFMGAGLEKLTIPETVSSIGTYSFTDCDVLLNVIWPSSLPLIPEHTFAGCTSLTTIDLPDNLKTIDKYAFNNCDSLVTFVMPDSVTTMNENVFNDCDGLREIQLSRKLQSINSSTFYDCDSLASINIPYSVTSIGSSAFYDCDALETVDMANSVTSLGSSAFKHCDALKNVKLSRNLTAIPSEAFRECAELAEIVIPYFTTKIEANAFNSSPKLTKVVTHEKLETINTSAFSYADRTVFYGPTGSYTNTWCTDNGYSFVENTAATTKVTAAESSVTIPKGKTFMLDFDIDPIDFHEVITTKSSNTAVATVDEAGKITAVAPGTATIKIIVGGASASCKVTVTQGVTKITLDKTKLSLDVPETYQFTATITPADASNKTLNWTSSNPAAATVDENGLVTAVGNGTAVIKAESTDGTGISASCTVTVIDPSKIPVSSITLDKSALSLEAMETYQLTASVSPANAANNALIWTSSNEAVATVDSNGQVTAVAKGTATITATAADGYGASASCTVTVTNNGYVVTALDQFRSSHPYENSCSDFWLYTQPGAGSVSITFDAETEMEDGFDYLYIYDGEGNLIGKYTGTELANQTITIPGDTVKVQIESDDSGNAWGFRVTDIGFTDHTHSFTHYVSDGNATCTEDGTKTAKCDHCDATDTIPDVGSALGHSFGSWTVIQEPTTTEDGLEERSCSRCGHTEQRTIAKLENPFSDVVPGSFFYDPVMWAIENGITNGTSATTFSPSDQCMRAHVVTFLWRAVGCPEPTKMDNPFVDVKSTDFYYKPVLWAVENGITSGMDATHFGPTAYCNRAQVVTFLYRTVGSPAVDASQNPFTDVPTGQWFTAPVLWAVENGITNGVSATIFGPNTICNRAQIVTFLYRAFA